MVTFGPSRRGLLIGKFVGGVEIQNALAGVAHDGLRAGTNFVIGLRAEHDAAGHTLLIANLGQAATAKLGDTLVVTKQVVVNAGANLLALGTPCGKKFFVFGGTLAGYFFFLFDFGGFGFQFGLGSLDFLVAGVGVNHHLENLVFVGGDFLFGELHLAH